MFYVDDHLLDRSYLERVYSLLDAHPVIGRASALRVAVRVSDAAFWLGLCLYMKERGKSVFPLPADAPREAARRRAQRAGCEYLFFGVREDALETPELIRVPDASPPWASRPSLIQMSSGTTGAPKVVDRSWSDIDVEVEHYARDFTAASTTTPIVAAPVTHSYGLISGVMAAIARGAAPRVVSNLNPKYVLRKIAETPAPLVYSSPSLIRTLCMLAASGQSSFSIVTSGTTLPRASFESILTKVERLHQQYGCSEAGCITVAEDIRDASDLGVPLSHLRVETGTGARAPGPVVVELPDGSTIETGDLGYFERGRLRFLARVDDMINVAGLKVYPTEVEEVVLEMPEVSEAVVFGRSRGLGHQEVALQFVSDREVSSDVIRAFCAARLMSFQVPMSITRVETIAKLPNGKISRKALADA